MLFRSLDADDDDPDAALLSPEAEADLQYTLATLEAETASRPTLDAATDTKRSIAPLDDASPRPATQHPEKALENKFEAAPNDAAVDRLLARTNTQLQVPETQRRRSAIAHLKAAVLATVADRMNNPQAQAQVAEVKMDPYRQDLSQAVRPSTAPGLSRPAPLVLVSAQRIDRSPDDIADASRPVPQIAATSAPAPGAPVRPRRVASGGPMQALFLQPANFAAEDDEDHEDGARAIAAQSEVRDDGASTGFAEFADRIGATTLAELIEAAGAYCTLVLNRPNFSRPMLFQQISALSDQTASNREEGLRGFGKLLRDGRIQKTERGQYALSETSPILAEAKRIAG